MNDFEKTLRTTAYLESEPTKPLCRHYCDAHDRDAEALLDILDAGTGTDFGLDTYDGSALLSPVDLISYDGVSSRLEEWEDMIPVMSKLNSKGLEDVVKFVHLVVDAYEHHKSPVIVVSVEV